MLQGNLGQPPGGWPEALQKKVLKGETPPRPSGPGAVMPPADLGTLRAELQGQAGEAAIDDEDFCGYLMYPKVFTDYFSRHRDYGPVRTLPTPVFFYGMEPGAGDLGRDRPRQDHRDPAAGGRRDQRGGRRPGLLRAERPAAHGAGAEPQGAGRDAEAAEGRGRQPGACRGADAGGDRQRRGGAAASRCRRAT